MNYDIKNSAINNYNYFFMKLIVKVFQTFLILSIILIICGIINKTFIYIIGLFYSLYSLYNIYDYYNRYNYIINDIKKTLDIKTLSFEINLNTIRNNMFKGIFNYGK